ncbi:MAG: hypothetical protein KDC17_11865 [Actinobacteria bacterium]|nr:hypothetical protein [Actinomycetota bacterium]
MLTELQIEKWLSGRLGDWFEQVEVFVDREEITIMGRLTAQDTDDEMALVGRITRFREQTREERIGVGLRLS